MKNIRLILVATTGVSASASIVAGIFLGPIWTIVVGTVGILATVVISTYAIIKSIQTVLQRQSSGLRQHERLRQMMISNQQKIDRSETANAQRTAQVTSNVTQMAAMPSVHEQLREMQIVTEHIAQEVDSLRSSTVDKRPDDLAIALKEAFVDDPEVEFFDDSPRKATAE